MSLWLLPIGLLLGGGAVWAVGRRVVDGQRRRVVGGGGAGLLMIAVLLTSWAVAADWAASYPVGAGLALHVAAGPVAGPVAVLVVAVAAVVTAYASRHEELAGLDRLVGLLVAFAGAMLLVVLANDLLTLTIGWELVGVLSWALIGHRWRDATVPPAAAHAYNATRFGGLGLVLAAGAAFASTGTLGYESLSRMDGVGLQVVVAGVLLAAVSKSALVPFSPWLFSAMAGPTSVSALLHSSTMVAAGVYALIRLQPVLDTATWFGPTAIGIGLATALAGGVVALLQGHAKKLLAASTSAQYGLMVVAVGAGYPQVAMLHLVAHALFKAQLFLSAGVAIEAARSPDLARMRLGGVVPTTARLTLVASLALAAIPPLGAAFTKEQVLAAGTEAATWVGLTVAVGGGLSAAYAARFQLLAFGSARQDRPLHRQVVRRPDRVEVMAMAVLAAASIILGLLWVPAVEEAVVSWLGAGLPATRPWELPLSLGLVVAAGYAVVAADRRGGLGRVPTGAAQRAAADWLALPQLTRTMVVAPTLRLATALAAFDDRVVDGGVERVAGIGRQVSNWASDHVEVAVDGVVQRVAMAGMTLARLGVADWERGIEAAVTGIGLLFRRVGQDARRTQTGLVHHQYVVIAITLVVAVAAAILGR